MGRGRDVLVFRAAWRGVLGRAGADGVWGAARAGRRGRGRQDGARRGGEQASCGVGGRTRTMARIFISSGARALPPKPAARLVPATPAEPFLLLPHLPPAACARQLTPRSRPLRAVTKPPATPADNGLSNVLICNHLQAAPIPPPAILRNAPAPSASTDAPMSPGAQQSRARGLPLSSPSRCHTRRLASTHSNNRSPNITLFFNIKPNVKARQQHRQR